MALEGGLEAREERFQGPALLGVRGKWRDVADVRGVRATLEKAGGGEVQSRGNL